MPYYCQCASLSRLERKTWFERAVFAVIGLFPFGCRSCGCQMYLFRRS